MRKNLYNTHFIFLITLILGNLVLAIYATPVFDSGDSVAYLQMGKTFASHGDGMSFASRSPLYPLILATLLTVFSEYTAINIMIFLQYFLVALTAWMIYKIFLPYFHKPLYPIIVALIFNFSLSTIYYSNLLLTEILTVFIFISAIYVLIKIYQHNKPSMYLVLGIMLGLLVLARYNTIPVLFTFIFLLIIHLVRKKARWGFMIKAIVIAIIPLILIINSWCFYNYKYYGFYNLFPSAGSTYQPRNVIVASITSENTVSKEYEPVLQIFLNARQEFSQMEKANIKGGLSHFDKNNFLGSMYDGYLVYLAAKPDLLNHFRLEDNNSELALAKKLDPFYAEIKKQNKTFIRKCRYYSLISTFRASAGGGLPIKYGKINLNILPSKIFLMYKISMIGISIFFWIGFFYYLFRIIRKKFRFDMGLLSFFGLTISFWLINFIFITVNDSNRFKFPTEPILFGIFILIVVTIFHKVKKFVKKSPHL